MGITGVITSRDQEVEDAGLDASMPSDLFESLASLAWLLVQCGQSIAHVQIVLSGTCIHAIDCP